MLDRFTSDSEAIQAYCNEEITLDVLARYLDEDLATAKLIASRVCDGKEAKRSKYGNIKVEENGQVFDSLGENGHHHDLLLQQAGGLIHDLDTQKPFVLQAAFTDAFGNHHKAINHIVDFFYMEENGQVVVEDYKSEKGKETEVWRIKHKLFCRIYVDVEYRVVYKKDR